MRIAVIGRTRLLLEAARAAVAAGFSIAVVWTCRAEAYYRCPEDEFEKFAAEVGAAFVNDERINSDASRRRLEALGCEAAISANWLTVIRRPVLDVFRLGVLNVHFGDLPRYRGNAVVNWAILNGENVVGVCIHRMTGQLDAGPVLLRKHFELGPDTYVSDVHRWFEAGVPRWFVEVLAGLADGTIAAEQQSVDPGAVLRCYPRRPEDSQIDWRRPVESVYRMVRASSHPFSGAFSTLEGTSRVTIWRGRPVDNRGAFLAIPGQVCYAIDNDPVIACADGILRLTEIDVEGVPHELAKRVVLRSLRNRLT